MAKSKLLKRRGPKKKISQSKREIKAINEKYWGAEEPIIPKGVFDGGLYSQALSWYNIMGEYLDGTPKSWVLRFLKSRGRTLEHDRLRGVPDKWIPITLSSQVRLLERGARLSSQSLSAMEKFIQEALRHEGEVEDAGVEKSDASESDETLVVEKPTIQDRTKEKTSEIIGELEGLIDEGFWDGFKLDTWYREKNAKPATIRKIIEKFRPVLDELREAKLGKDEQLRDAYSFLEKDDISVYIEMYEWLIDDSTRFITNVKQTRAPRVAKPPSIEKKIKFLKDVYQKRSSEYNIESIPPERILGARVTRAPRVAKPPSIEKKIKFLKDVYQKRSSEYNIESIPPERILGAQELWTFNSKYKILTVFRAESHGGALDVARCKITGFDKNISISKRTGRKTAEVVDKLMKATKSQLRKFMDDLKGDGLKLPERINENTVLLRSST